MSLPLGVVVLVSMIKDAFEDYQRHKSDNEENTKITHVYDTSKKTFEKQKWADLRPGMLVKINEDEFFPADIVVL
jgi:P-type E1-E2 ATPase